LVENVVLFKVLLQEARPGFQKFLG
jgi:hypothetical protein